MPRILLFPAVSIRCPECGQTIEPPPVAPAAPVAVRERWLVRAMIAAWRSTPTPAPAPAPEAGDITICHYCGDVLVFTGALTVASMPAEAWWTLPQDTRDELQRLQYRMLRRSPPSDDT